MPDLNIVLTDITAEIEADAVRNEEAADAKEPGLKPGPFGIAVTMLNGERFCSGAAATPFPLKSVAKVFALEIVLCAIGDEIFERVGREPSGDPFNLIVDLERTDGIPRNPFVNAGALVTVDALITSFKRQRLKTRLMQVKHQKKRNFSASTFACGSRNRSLR